MGVCSSQKAYRQHNKYQLQQQYNHANLEQNQQNQIQDDLMVNKKPYYQQEQNEQNNVQNSNPQQNSIRNQNQVVLSARLLQKDLTCKECNKHFNQDKIITIEKCKHAYDIQCFTKHFKETKKCCSEEKKIIISERYYAKELVNEIMKHQLNKLLTKVQDKMLIVQCPTQFCSFVFFYKKELNNQQTKKFYCNRCEQLMIYDAKMCKFIEKQTVFKSNKENDAQIYQKLQIKTSECTIQDHLSITNVQTQLSCSHNWCKICLFKNYKDCLKAICQCGQRYPTNIVKGINQEEEWFNIYERQLDIIKKEAKLNWQFCKNNCGFFFVDDQNLDKDYYCMKCDQIKNCNKCNKEVLSQYITLNNCQHYYHLLCSFDLLMKDNLKNMSCQCSIKLDEDTKIQMNIKCFQCQKYDDNLIMFQCFHFIHKECLESNLQLFSSFKCPICQISLGNIFNEPRFLSIKDKLLETKQQENKINNNYCQQCGNNYSIGNVCNCQFLLSNKNQIQKNDYK